LIAGLLGILALQNVATAQWLNRTVTEVNGTFNNIQPSFGFETGLGTNRVDWGVPIAGSFTSYLSFQGYDRFPGFEQPWFSGGQTVMPGQEFLLGTLAFRNGSVTASSSSPNLSVDLNLSVFGSEFYIDNHPLLIQDRLRISIVQTPNQGIDPVADADYIYFTDFPSLGSFRVFEGQSTSIPIYARFGSLEPTRFGDVEDPTAGVVLPYVTAVSPVPAPPAIALAAVGAAGLGGYRLIRRSRARSV
jgi:hypothetical protein